MGEREREGTCVYVCVRARVQIWVCIYVCEHSRHSHGYVLPNPDAYRQRQRLRRPLTLFFAAVPRQKSQSVKGTALGFGEKSMGKSGAPLYCPRWCPLFWELV